VGKVCHPILEVQQRRVAKDPALEALFGCFLTLFDEHIERGVVLFCLNASVFVFGCGGFCSCQGRAVNLCTKLGKNVRILRFILAWKKIQQRS
jgi:hypothetical protein